MKKLPVTVKHDNFANSLTDVARRDLRTVEKLNKNLLLRGITGSKLSLFHQIWISSLSDIERSFASIELI